jgi:hypothetical protein
MVEEALGVEVQRPSCADYTGRLDKRARETRAIDSRMVGSPSAASGNPPSGAVKKFIDLRNKD